MNVRLTRHLLGRLLRGRRFLGLSALASVAGLVAWVTFLGEPPGDPSRTLSDIVATAPAATLSIAVLFLATAVLRDERDGGTLPFLFVTPIGRLTFAVSAWLAAAAAAVVVAVIGWVVLWAGTGLASGNWTVAFPALAVYVPAAVGYSALFVPLGYLFSRSLLVGLGYVFVWEGILATVVSGIGSSSVWRIALSIWAGVDELSPDALDVLGSVSPGAGGGLAVLGGFVVGSIAVLAWALKARDAV